MRVPFEWLKDFVDIAATVEEVADKLTMIGFEVEAVETVQDDIVLEVNVTPNRPDCLSIIGIAREISAAINLPLKLPPHDIKDKTPLSDYSVEILDSELCNRYAGRVIKGVKITESPEWIKRRLEKCGMRSINSVVDITNYVLLEYGHPLHAFDADLIQGKKIKVAVARKKNKILTLDGLERELPEDALLIWDDKRPIAVAGVMGGLETEVSDRTKNIFLESAYFEPFSIRRTSKKLNLASESSYRFERGTDIEFLEKALNRAAIMIRDIAGGTIYEIIDDYPVKYVSEPVKVTYERINKILGTEISKREVIEILSRLGIEAESKGDVFIFYPPAFRRDIKRDYDVAEEIARSYGFERIPSRIPRGPLSTGQKKEKMMNVNMVREAMRKSGFTEVINYSFMSPSTFDLLGILGTDRRRNTISIKNPLKQEESLLRTTLIPSLIENFKYNLDRGIKDIKLFEIATTFEDIGKPLPLEELRLGGIFYREKVPSLWKEDAQGFYMVKGALELLFKELKIKGYSFIPSTEPFLHRGQSSNIYVTETYMGFLGVLSADSIERLDLKKKRPEIVIIEINLDHLLKLIPESITYTPIPIYPCVERDIAIVVHEDVPASEILEMIGSFPSELIEEVSIFDYYRGGNIPEGRKSLAFGITYRSKEKTLTDEEVELLHASLVKHVLEKTGGELRK